MTRQDRRPAKGLLMTAAAAFLLLAPGARSAGAHAQETRRLHVVTTLSVLGDLARKIGGEHVEVETLADPRQDPHYVQPRPTLMKRVRDADLFVEIGLDLELWAQKVVDGAANPRIARGQRGRVIASEGVPTLELPESVSREWGDVHPYGNPHVWLDPIRLKRIAANIAAALAENDPTHRADYERRRKELEERIDVALFGEALVKEVGGDRLGRLALRGRLREYLERKDLAGKAGGWLKRAEPLQGKRIVTYHKTWAYFTERFGLSVVTEVEENPGIPPSARHRDRVIEMMKAEGVDRILVSSFYDRGAADYVAGKTGARVVVVPIVPGAVEGVDDVFSLMDHLLEKLTATE